MTIPPTRSGQAWTVPVPAGRLAALPCWRSPSQWLADIKAHLATPEGEAQRASAHVAAGTLLEVASHDAGSADRRTGRDVTTCHDTVAKALGCRPKTVQRARGLLIAMGFSVEIERGRYLTAQEREQARAHHGRTQLRMASTRACVSPHRSSHVHLPRRGQLGGNLPVRSTSPRRAQARAKATKNPEPRPRPSLAIQRIAAGLAQRFPWLARTHIGNLCQALIVAGVDPTASANDLITALDRRNRDHGLSSLSASAQRSPLALLIHQLREALPQFGELPSQMAARQRAEVLADSARRRAAAAARDEQLALERADPDLQTKSRERRALLQDHLRRLNQVNRDLKAKSAAPVGDVGSSGDRRRS